MVTLRVARVLSKHLESLVVKVICALKYKVARWHLTRKLESFAFLKFSLQIIAEFLISRYTFRIAVSTPEGVNFGLAICSINIFSKQSSTYLDVSAGSLFSLSPNPVSPFTFDGHLIGWIEETSTGETTSLRNNGGPPNFLRRGSLLAVTVRCTRAPPRGSNIKSRSIHHGTIQRSYIKAW